MPAPISVWGIANASKLVGREPTKPSRRRCLTDRAKRLLNAGEALRRGKGAMADPASDIFLSYKAEDRSRLVPLVAALEAEGFSLWWDAHIGGGANWHEVIERQLDTARCVLVAWSKRSVGPEGQFVRDEARRAQRRGAYLPVRIDAVDPPLGFGEIQAISLKNWKGDRSDPSFLSIVEAIRAAVTGQRDSRSNASTRGSPISRRVLVAGGVGAAAVAAAGGWALLRPSALNANRIAVLPFADLSGAQDQTYFAEGIAEELRSALSRVGLEVIGRASSDAVKSLDTKAAAARLGVGNILTGSVRRSPQTVRISAQLVGASDGVEHWAQTYDRSPGDEIKIQTDIAINVAQALSVALGRAGEAALSLGGSADSDAHDLVLRARKLLSEADGPQELRVTLALVEQAIARDPNYADAYVEKANVLVHLAARYGYSNTDVTKEFADAEAAANKAVVLAPALGSTRSALAELELGRLDFARGLQNLKRAIALAPNSAEVLGIGARELPWIGSAEEGLRLANAAIALDPLNGTFYQWQAYALIVLRRYRDAITAARTGLEVAPKQQTLHVQIGNAMFALGELGQAKAEYLQMPADYPLRMAGEGMVAARSGDLAEADRIVARMRGLIGAARYQYGQIYVQAGDLDRAFAEFRKAADAKTPGMIYFRSDPLIDPIRKDVRYKALLEQLRFTT